MPSKIDLKTPQRSLHVGVVLLKSVTELLDVAPIDLLNGLNNGFLREIPSFAIPDDLKAQGIDIVFHWITETGAPAELTSGLSVNATDSFATCPPLDIVLLGANKIGDQPDEAEIAFLQKCYSTSSAFLCICGGIMPALAAGLLEGKTVTAPRALLGMLRAQSPGVNWVEKRWANDGKIWTSGALNNGLDMMAAFESEVWGGDGTLAEHMLRWGSVPRRDIDYKDVSWST